MNERIKAFINEGLEAFIRESNRIEGEDDLPIDVDSLVWFLSVPLTEESLHKYHTIVSGNQERSGKWRTVKVRVGNFTPPLPFEVEYFMDDYFERLSVMDARQAHNEFEKIHPYQDFNGRMGRAIWLHKMGDAYNFKLGFLHHFYYQCLQHYEQGN